MEETRAYTVSNLVGTGVRPFRSTTSFLNSPSLKFLEPIIRGSFSNFMVSMKPDAEERLIAPLDAAINGLCCVLEMLSRDVLVSFLDELFLYVRSATHLAVGPVTNLLGQMLKVLFDRNAVHINSNLIVSLKVRHSVTPAGYSTLKTL